MVEVKQGNAHTFKMYTRVRSVVVDIYQLPRYYPIRLYPA